MTRKKFGRRRDPYPYFAQSESLKRLIEEELKQRWPDCDVTYYEEKRKSPHPDMDVLIGDYKVPIESKSRHYGCFYLEESPRVRIIYGTIPPMGSEQDFSEQMYAALNAYGVSVFITDTDVRPCSPCFSDAFKGRVVLARLPETARAVEFALEYLRCKRS